MKRLITVLDISSHAEGGNVLGKKVRMERITDRNTGQAVIVPMDHGISLGPVKGLIDMKGTVDAISEGGATAVVEHKGIVPYGHRSFGKDIGLIIHLSASTSLGHDPNAKVLVTTVEEAIKMGADAVSIHVNIGSETDSDMIKDFGAVSRTCTEWGMPLLVMIYPRGKDIEDPFDVDHVKHCARVGAELGADIVKTNYTGDPDSFKEVVQGALAPVVIAGGPKIDSTRDLLQMVKDAKSVGGRGASIGRNIFQHDDIMGMTKAVSGVLLHDMEVDEALKLIK
ncbi:MAG: 2-amino-3,7-dideoxy-D-threo-hept-6-ulosonate synthase [Methanomassiliicoccales archaeon]